MRNNVCKRILAGLSVVAMLVTMIGAMPVTFATATTVDLMPLVDFNSGWFKDGAAVWTAANTAITETENQIFRVGALAEGKSLSILSHNGNSDNKYLQSESNNLYYQATNNSTLAAHQGLVAGDTLVVSADFNTAALNGGTTAKFRAKANTGAADPVDLTYFALTPNNEFVLYNGGNTALASMPVRDDEWISINVVYVVGESSITASVYVNGHLQKLTKASGGEPADVNTLTHTSDNRFTAPYTRFYFEYGCWDNLRVRKISGGSFDPSTLEKEAIVTEVMPLVDFNSGWFLGGTNVWTEANKAITETENQIFRVGAIGTGKNLSILSHNGNSNDKYLQSGSNNLYYQATNNSTLAAHQGLENGDSLVVSADFNTTSLNTDVPYFAATPSGGSEFYIFSFNADNELVLYSGAKTVLGYMSVPDDQWINITVVYTKNNAESVTARVYMNGVLQQLVSSDRKTTYTDCPMANANIANPVGAFARFTLKYGMWDNVSVKAIKYGTYNPSTVTPYTLDIMPEVNFDNWESKTAEAAGIYNGNGAPKNQIFRFNSASAITIVNDNEEGTDRSMQFNSNNLQYNIGAYTEGGFNNSIGYNHAHLNDGEQLVISTDLNTGSIRGAANYSRLSGIMYYDPANLRSNNYRAQVSFFQVDENNNLTLGNGGDYNSGMAYYKAGNKHADLAYVTLPDDEWANITVVYTAYSVEGVEKVKASVYVNGDLQTLADTNGNGVTEIDLTYADAIRGQFSRIDFVRGHWDNISVKKIAGGTFDPSTLTKSPYNKLKLINALGFDANDTATNMAANSYAVSVDGSHKIYANDASSDILVANKQGKATTDKYWVVGEESQIRAIDNQTLKNSNAAGYKPGDQLVFSTQINTDLNNSREGVQGEVGILYGGDRYYSAEADAIANYSKLFAFKNVNVSSNYLDKLVIYNGENAAEDGDDVAEAELATIALPKNRWSTVTVVLTVGDTAVATAGAAGTAEVLSGVVPDTITVYVNGKLALEPTALAESNIFRGIDTIKFTGANSMWDNIYLHKYFNGNTYTNPSPFADDDYCTSIRYNNSIFLQDITAQEFDALVKAKEGVNATYIKDNGTAFDPSNDAITDLGYLILDAGDDTTYIATVSAARDIHNFTDAATTPFMYIRNVKGTLEGGEPGAFKKNNIKEDVVGFTGDAVATDAYGKANNDTSIKVTHIADIIGEGDWEGTANETETEYTVGTITRISPVQNKVGVTGKDASDAEPIYISFDFIAESDETFTTAIYLNLDLWQSDAVKTSRALTITKDVNGLKIADVNLGYKEWHNVAVQLIPGSEDVAIYLDGTQVKTYKLTGKYEGMNTAYLDVTGDTCGFDNLIAKTGIYTPAKPETITLTVDENTSDWGWGTKWVSDGNYIETNKADLKYNANIVDNFTGVTFINAAGAALTGAEGDIIDQITVADNNGYIHYYKVVKRSGVRFIEDYAADKVYLLDVADKSGYTRGSVSMFVVRYTDADKNEVQTMKVYAPDVDGDTLFFSEVEYDSATESMYILHNGTLAPLK